jgi:hypothetical protein
VIEKDIFTDVIMGENLSDSPIIYFFEGLIEGFVFLYEQPKGVLWCQRWLKGARSYTNIHKWHRLFKSLR